jgi:hypothetical protein
MMVQKRIHKRIKRPKMHLRNKLNTYLFLYKSVQKKIEDLQFNNKLIISLDLFHY